MNEHERTSMRNYIIPISLVLLIVTLNACSDDSPYRPQPRSAIQLAEMTFRNKGGTRLIFDSKKLSIYYSGDVVKLPEIGLTGGSEGYAVVMDTSAVGVAGFFEKMTNGIDEMLFAKFIQPNGFGQDFGYESYWIDGGTTGDLRPDLQGASISKAVIHLDKVIIDSPGDDPNGDGIWTSYDITVRLEIRGFFEEWR
jgi:hypothetical protein